MARHRSRSDHENQMDPFNAGEPSLPWEEPETPFADEPRAPTGPQPVAEQPRQQGRGYQAPSRPASTYDAPSTKERPPAQPARRPFRGKRAIIIAIVAIFIAPYLLSMLFLLVSCAADVVFEVGGSIVAWEEEDDSGWDLTWEFGDSDTSGGFSSTESVDPEDAGLMTEAVDAGMSALLADPTSGELHERAVAYLDEQFLESQDLTAAELGIDADAWATWLLGQASWEVEGLAPQDESSAYAILVITAPNAENIFWNADEEIFGYLADEGVSGGELTEGQRSRTAELFDEAVADVSEPDVQTHHVLLTLEGGAWVADDAELLEALTYSFSL